MTVVSGDCLSSIAARFGLTWPILWDAPENAGLRQKRKDPNILYPGDQVFVPETKPKGDPAATGQRHNYEVDIEPTFVKLRFLFMGLPRKGIRWALMLSDREMDSGVLDADGFMESRIDARAETGRLRLFPENAPPEDYVVKLGHLDPVEVLTGIQQRLANLGIDPGPLDGIDGPKTKAAVKRFQTLQKLSVDGIAGPITQGRLKQVHGG